jgi:hypothetical protein
MLSTVSSFERTTENAAMVTYIRYKCRALSWYRNSNIFAIYFETLGYKIGLLLVRFLVHIFHTIFFLKKGYESELIYIKFSTLQFLVRNSNLCNKPLGHRVFFVYKKCTV